MRSIWTGEMHNDYPTTTNLTRQRLSSIVYLTMLNTTYYLVYLAYIICYGRQTNTSSVARP